MPGNPSDDDVRIAASRFRAAIDVIGPQALGVWAERFPAGFCAICSEMLARYLNRHLDISPQRAFGEVKNQDGSHRSSHVWLLWEGLIIDVTGDQFGWRAVIVSRTSAQHDAIKEVRYSAFVHDPQWWGRECAAIWAATMRCLGEQV